MNLKQNISYKLVPYKECWRELLDLRNRNREQTRDKAYMDWRYLERPCALESQIVWAVADDGTPVGSMSLVPHNYFLIDKVVSVGILGDISVEEAFRGQRIADNMLSFLEGQGFYQSLGGAIVLPNQAASKFLERSGWKRVSGINRYLRINNFKESFRGRLPLVVNTLAAGLFFVVDRVLFSAARKTIRAGYEVEVVSDFDDSFDVLWDKFHKSGKMIGVRDRDHLQWRYGDHPLHSYEVLKLTASGELQAYIVYEQTGSNVMVYDMLSLNEGDSSRVLLAAFVKHVKQNSSIHDITLSINDNSLVDYPLLEMGFIKRKDSLAFMRAASFSGGDAFSAEVDEEWYLTIGDKDV